jgi:type II secretory pathway pseudopilin PulG
MAKNKHRSSLWGWWLVVVILIMIAILVYPSVFRVTQKQAQVKTAERVAAYQKAVAACYEKNKRQLTGCDAGKNGIPPVTSSWFGTIKSIHVYRGVIQVRVKMNLGEPLFIYYVPRPVPRRWFSDSTNPKHSFTWQRIESSYCGLDNKTYSCRQFVKG